MFFFHLCFFREFPAFFLKDRFVFGRFFFPIWFVNTWGFHQDFYERYALYERHNLHGRLKRPAASGG